MEEPQEVHTDENRALPDKKQRRIVKTPTQVAALENFYNEHKYPTEAMKLELAESIGLTEKQVSGWFCHRRLKDKKSPNDEVQGHGKQDRSSGVIQDRGSGLRQDSCGSTKQGDNKHSDAKEVESRRFTAERLLPTEVRYEHGSQHNNSIMDDDTSSGSSSPLEDDFHPQNVGHLGTMTSKYPTYNDVKSVKGKTGPSGYLKVKGQVENAAITAVKRQLGRHYREDGPPLGIEFESLPPGSFESLVKIPVNQSYYVGDRTTHHPLDGSKMYQLPNVTKTYERNNPRSYHPLDLDESGLEIRHASKNCERQYKQTPALSKHRNSLSRRSLQMEVDDDSAGETSIHDLNKHFEMRTKHGPDAIYDRHQIAYGKNIQRNHSGGAPKLIYRDRMEPLTSEFSLKRGEFVELEDRGTSRKMFKDDEFNGERRGIDDYSKLISAKVHLGNEMRVGKRSREEFTHQGHPRKEVVVDVPSRTTMSKRSTGEMSSSYSDDESAETTSSGN